jgi:predicted enzyme related to lactoylglutathione lyase
MGRRNGYAPGTFSGVELATRDHAAATGFYGGLFGWSADGDGVLRLGGDAVAGLVAPGRDDVPAGWLSTVTVDDAAAVGRRAAAHGGGAAGELIIDPQGAVVAVRAATAWPGAARVNEPGCLCMNELITPDLDAARAFYEPVFGWATQAFGGPEMVLVLNRGAVNGSMIAVERVPAHWRPCFAVTSTGEALRQVRELGGTVLSEPLEIPDGSLAVAADPEGNPFSLFAGDLDP